MNNLQVFLLIAVQLGSYAFSFTMTIPSFGWSARSSFFPRIVLVATELKSEASPAEELASVNIEATQPLSDDSDEVLFEEVTSTDVDSSSTEASPESDTVGGAQDEDSSSTEAFRLDEDEDAKSENPNEKKMARVLSKRHTVFIGNLPFDVTKEELEERCSDFGEIQRVVIPRRQEDDRPRGFAFIDFASGDEAQKAIEALDDSVFNGRTIRASLSGKNKGKVDNEKIIDADRAKVYVGNLPFGTSREELFEFFNQFGEAYECYIPFNAETGTGRGYAFITIKSEDLESVIEKTNGADFQGRPLVVSVPLPAGVKKQKNSPPRNQTKLYVGNLDFSTDAEILTEVFGEFGEVLDCYLPEDNERGGSRGFAFVTMSKEDAIQAIAELDGCELDGRSIRVNEAKGK